MIVVHCFGSHHFRNGRKGERIRWHLYFVSLTLRFCRCWLVSIWGIFYSVCKILIVIFIREKSAVWLCMAKKDYYPLKQANTSFFTDGDSRAIGMSATTQAIYCILLYGNLLSMTPYSLPSTTFWSYLLNRMHCYSLITSNIFISTNWPAEFSASISESKSCV